MFDQMGGERESGSDRDLGARGWLVMPREKHQSHEGTRARLLLHADEEFDVVHFKPVTGEWGLRDNAGEIIVFESDLAPSDLVEVRCDFCGRWSTDAAPTTRVQGASWMCFGGTGPCPEDCSP
jgi:hypothetical protein